MRCFALILALMFAATASSRAAAAELVRSRQSGPWSAATTWEGGRAPAAGDSVFVRAGHRVTYDADSTDVIRVLHVAGTLAFAPDRDTRLDVGLLRVQPGDTFAGEANIDAHVHAETTRLASDRPALEIGTLDTPIAPDHTAIVRLTYIDGMDRDTCPALVANGGRVELHGTPMNRTWVKLGFTTNVGEDRVFLGEPVGGWKIGDHVLITATSRQYLYTDTYTKSVGDAPRSEERTITKIDRHHDRTRLTLDKPLAYAHRGEGKYRGEVANLSRNVVIESADAGGVRGHTMFTHGSAASIGYAEFRHLGKRGVLGRYPIHFHHARDSMRGSSVVGASIWDSANHLLTVHDTQYLIVRDCVGYRSLGHGFYLEDGTETFNVFDRNLAVMAMRDERLPNQFLPFDRNDGAGFWWANSGNVLTRNVAVECDQYGFRFEVIKSDRFDATLDIAQPDGSVKSTDLRTIPFIRFEGNEAHAQRRFGINLGGIASHRGYGNDDPNYQIQTDDVDGVGPDRFHPFVLTDSRQWDCQWPFHAGSPMVVVNGMDIADSEYGLWRSVTLNHQYHDLTFANIRSHTIFFPRTGGPSQFDPSQEPPPQPKDDRPPVTVIESITRDARGRWIVCGTSSDDGPLAKVLVNDVEADIEEGTFGQWRVVLDASEAGTTLTAHGVDAAGNAEVRPHSVRIPPAK